jgi:hypothetical protein
LIAADSMILHEYFFNAIGTLVLAAGAMLALFRFKASIPTS